MVMEPLACHGYSAASKPVCLFDCLVLLETSQLHTLHSLWLMIFEIVYRVTQHRYVCENVHQYKIFIQIPYTRKITFKQSSFKSKIDKPWYRGYFSNDWLIRKLKKHIVPGMFKYKNGLGLIYSVSCYTTV